MPYLLDHGWENERARLATLARALDPETTRCLDTLGVAAGWQCLEVGGGGGSIAQWLCRRVGPLGRVVATDLETAFLEAIDEPNLEVRRHDIAADELETDTFDLVHCRAVLEHLPPPARHAAIERMIAALKPGGWLLAEDGDTATFLPASPHGAELFVRCVHQFEAFIIANGGAPHYGRRLRAELLDHGLSEVTLKGFLFEWGGDLPQTAIWLYNYQRMRERVVAAGLLSNDEVDAFLTLIETPNFRAFSPTLVTAWGQKQLHA
ncbi:MAG: class I SAM-dependent methyltransferase [Roseiflexaceae bacterium]